MGVICAITGKHAKLINVVHDFARAYRKIQSIINQMIDQAALRHVLSTCGRV